MDRRKDIINALQKDLERSVAFFGSLTPAQLNREIYHDGARWTSRQVMAHFVTIERSMHSLFKDILSGGAGSPRDFDVDRFNKSQTAKLNAVDIDDLIVRFRRVRLRTIAMVEDMAESDLDRKGHHAFHGHGRLEKFIRWAYEHAQLHETDIRKILTSDVKDNL